MRVKVTIFSAFILAATLLAAQESRFGSNSSSDADSHNLIMQGCLGTSFQDGNHTLTNAQTATVYTLLGDEDLNSYVGKQVEVIGEPVTPSSISEEMSSQTAQIDSPPVSSTAEARRPYAGGDTQMLHVSRVTKLAEHCLLSNKKESSSASPKVRLVALNSAAQSTPQGTSGAPQSSPQSGSPAPNTHPNSQPPASQEPGNQPGSATPPGSAATPPGSTATPPGSTATPPSSTATPPGNTATPNGTQPCAGNQAQNQGTGTCGTPNNGNPGAANPTPKQGTTSPSPQSTPSTGNPPKA
jgi:hypothetical protein